MKYSPLSSIYYSNPAGYEAIYQQRYNSESTIRFEFDIHGSPAFVVVTPELTQIITNILQINGKIIALTSNLPLVALKQYQLKSLIDEIRLTNDIEGVYSTRKEIQALLDSDHSRESKRFAGLVNSYLLLTEPKKIALSTCGDVRKIYDALVANDVLLENPNDALDGEIFRKGPVYVCSRHGEVIHNGLVPESVIISFMTQALSFIHAESINSFIRIAVFHYLFGYIHPFYNGNGRVSRFISGYLLSTELTPIIGYRLSYTIQKNLDQYLKSFRTANNTLNKGDLTSFVLVFLNIVQTAMENLNSSLLSRKEQLEFYSVQSNKLRYSSRNQSSILFVLIHNALFGYSGISIDTISSATGLSIPTVRKSLTALFDQHLITRVQDGHKLLFDADLKEITNAVNRLQDDSQRTENKL